MATNISFLLLVIIDVPIPFNSLEKSFSVYVYVCVIFHTKKKQMELLNDDKY